VPSVGAVAGRKPRAVSVPTHLFGGGSVTRLVTTVRGALAVVGLAWLVQTGYWALRAELIVYLS